MAIRFNEAIIGMQFHAEVDPDGMHKYLLRDDKKKIVVEKHGEKKYIQMMQFLNDPLKIKLTYQTIVPNFLEAQVRAYAEQTDQKLGKVAQPLRAALTGSTVSPPVFDVMAVLGREEVLARIREQIG